MEGIQVPFKVFSVGSMLLPIGLGCVYVYTILRPTRDFDERVMYTNALFLAMTLSFTSIIICILFSIQKKSNPTIAFGVIFSRSDKLGMDCANRFNRIFLLYNGLNGVKQVV